MLQGALLEPGTWCGQKLPFCRLEMLVLHKHGLVFFLYNCLCHLWLEQKGCSSWMWPQRNCDLTVFHCSSAKHLGSYITPLVIFSPWHLGLQSLCFTPWHRGEGVVAQPLDISAPVLCLQVVLGGGQLFQSQQDLLHRTSPLLLSYYVIRWASQRLASDIPLDTL